jgi:hypothetical protein
LPLRPVGVSPAKTGQIEGRMPSGRKGETPSPRSEAFFNGLLRQGTFEVRRLVIRHSFVIREFVIRHFVGADAGSSRGTLARQLPIHGQSVTALRSTSTTRFSAASFGSLAADARGLPVGA